MEFICHSSPGVSSEQIYQDIKYIDDRQLFKTLPASTTEHAFPCCMGNRAEWED